MLQDPSGCPHQAGAPSLPYPKPKLARKGTEPTACNSRVAGQGTVTRRPSVTQTNVGALEVSQPAAP